MLRSSPKSPKSPKVLKNNKIFTSDNGLDTYRQFFLHNWDKSGAANYDLVNFAEFVEMNTISSNNSLIYTFSDIADQVCTMGQGAQYARESLAKLVLQPDRMDILLMMNRSNRIREIRQISDLIRGFILIERGECLALPHVWSVNLICGLKDPSRSFKGAGQVLLGAFLYCMKGRMERENTPPRNQFVILELARGYTNMEAFISYTKLGFVKDYSLYYPQEFCLQPNTWTQPACFCEENTISMRCNLAQFQTPHEILEVLANQRKLVITPDKDNTGMYNLFRWKMPIEPLQVKLQEVMAEVANQLMMAEKTEDIVRQDDIIRDLRALFKRYKGLFPRADQAKGIQPARLVWQISMLPGRGKWGRKVGKTGKSRQRSRSKNSTKHVYNFRRTSRKTSRKPRRQYNRV